MAVVVLDARSIAGLMKDSMHSYGLPLPVNREKVFKRLGLPSSGGEYFFYTGGLYQLAPYIRGAVEQLERLEESSVAGALFKVARVAGLTSLARMVLKPDKSLEERVERILESIIRLLGAAGVSLYYDPELDNYSGALLYDMGLVGEARAHAEKVFEKLAGRGVRRLVTVDPHTTHMLRSVYRDLMVKYGVEVRSYIEVLAENTGRLKFKGGDPVPVVIHDPCLYARYEGIIEQPRRLLEAAGYRVVEPRRARRLTYCCGGPIESLAPSLSRRIAENRYRELAGYASIIATLCPVCLLNLSAVSKPGVRVEDIAVLLAERLEA